MWYREAAEKGDGVAQDMLGRMHLKGDGVPKDYAQAVRWFRKAAEWGHPEVLYIISKIYMVSRPGVPEDHVETLKWAILAADRGHKEAKEMAELGRKALSTEQVNKAQKDAQAWADTYWKNFYPLLVTIPKP
jgi:hypothetical protein